MAGLKWLPEALDDLECLFAFLREKNPSAAARAAQTILEGADLLLTLPHRLFSANEVDSMIRLAKIVPAVLYLLLFAQPSLSQSLQIVESTFCLELKGSDCFRPIASDSISLQHLSVPSAPPQIYFWSAIKARTGKKEIMHVWSASGRADRWAAPVHVARSDHLKNMVIDLFIGALRAMYAADPSQHSVQGVILGVDRSSRYRTYSKIRAVPGTYTVQVVDYDRQVVPGGERKTITIRP